MIDGERAQNTPLYIKIAWDKYLESNHTFKQESEMKISQKMYKKTATEEH